MEKVKINYFGDWIKSITVDEYKEKRSAVICRCKITPQIFRHWKAGITPVPVLAHDIIENIAGKKVFNVEPTNTDAK